MIILDVTFKEKDNAKIFGAKWNSNLEKWYADDKSNYIGLMKWIEATPKNIYEFVKALINQTPEQKLKENECHLLLAYITMIFCLSPLEERNAETLVEMIKLSKISEDDEKYKNAIDYQFEAVEKWVNGTFSDEDDFFDFNELRNYTPTKQQLRLGKFACQNYNVYKSSSLKDREIIISSCFVRINKLISNCKNYISQKSKKIKSLFNFIGEDFYKTFDSFSNDNTDAINSHFDLLYRYYHCMLLENLEKNVSSLKLSTYIPTKVAKKAIAIMIKYNLNIHNTNLEKFETSYELLMYASLLATMPNYFEDIIEIKPQYEITDNNVKYRIDLVIYDCKHKKEVFAVECDGMSTHYEKGKYTISKDNSRQSYIQHKLGIDVRRYINAEIVNDSISLANEIWDYLGQKMR